MSELSPEVAAVLETLPCDEYATAEKLFEQLLTGGPDVIRQLVVAVGPKFGDAGGVKPKYAVHGLTVYAGRPGADGQRRLVAGALAKELGAEHSDELKAFLCRQLQLCGTAGEVPALAGLLKSDRLCEPAAQALQAIGGNAALKALRGAQEKADGDRKRTLDQAVEFVSNQ
ncbi:MAG: hypothetical protein RBS80_07970 [Thermoguttaceae bacterium]|jgi:hypothetical protein|nr:hypothetical protein [Thermoguttaceae bacterium]